MLGSWRLCWGHFRAMLSLCYVIFGVGTMLGVYGAYVGPMLIHVRLLEAMLGPFSSHVELMLSQERRVSSESSNFEGVTR